MRRILGKILLVIAIIIMNFTTCFAYSDELFKFDLPEEYTMLKHQEVYIFANSKNENRGFLIYVHPNDSIKKSVWDIEESDLRRLTNTLTLGSQVIKTDKKVKLGKEKAVEIVTKSRTSDEYMDIYILASNKYVYMVAFTAKSQAELNNSDYEMIKDNFKLKDRTTNYKVVYALIIIAVAGFSMYLKQRKLKKETYKNNVTPTDNDITHL